jgi:thioredoxin reductase (NADPH)
MNLKKCMTTDCLIIGAGPAGLVAGVYLARFQRSFVIVDDDQSRANWIDCSYNYPGYPDGISGKLLLDKLKKQLYHYKVKIMHDTVQTLVRQSNNIFVANSKRFVVYAQKVLLATGVTDINPNLPGITELFQQGYLRQCPICDGFEATNKNIGIIGNSSHGLKEALFLKRYTNKINLLTIGLPLKLNVQEQQQLQQSNINLIVEPIMQIKMFDKQVKAICIINNKHTEYTFDLIYSALGVKPHTQLALDLGSHCDQSNCLVVDHHQRTSIPNLYAAGDLVSGVNQICVAIGQGAVAAVDIHNNL